MTNTDPRGAEPDADLLERRALVEGMRAAEPLATGVSVQRVQQDGFVALRVQPAQPRSDCVLLHFHGGGFRLGSAASWLPFASRLVYTVGRVCYLIDYPLAPEHPFPTALDDGRAAYRWLSEQGVPIVLSGDSAGGGLAASLALSVAADGLDGHVGTVLYSPWLDLRVHAESYESNAAHDELFSRGAAEAAAAIYAVGGDTSDPLVSPVLGSWSGQPPVLLETSSTEVLRDDARLLARVLLERGVRAWFREVPRQPHDWQIAYPPLDTSLDSLRLTATFLDSLAS